MLLTRKANSAAAAHSRLVPRRRGHDGQHHRPPRFSQALRPHARRRRGGHRSCRFNIVGKAEAAQEAGGGKIEVKRTVCTHCSVGCAIDAVVQNGVWIRQEPVFDSPINLGAHCAKGASIREHGMTHDSHRLKSPMKLVGGKWKKISLGRGARTKSATSCSRSGRRAGPTRRSGSAPRKHNNEQAYPVAQVRVVLRHQQHGPPGAHLPLDHGGRRREHLGLWRDDQFLQRRTEFEVHPVLRQQRGGSAPGVDAAHAARQGERRQGDRASIRALRAPRRRRTSTTASVPAPTSRS